MTAKPIIDGRTGKPLTRANWERDMNMTPDPYVYVEASSPQDAREFFGYPVSHPCEMTERISSERAVYRLPSTLPIGAVNDRD